MLTTVQINQLKSALGDRERVLRRKVRKAIQEKYGRDLPELESLGDDSAQSVADMLDDIDTGMVMRDVDELMSIEAARAAIKGGSYGKCVTCHAPIGYKRLLALPSAERCLSCQEQHERTTWTQPEMKL
ncbi:MAG: TraR/DksA C4-type zinc finger protein [Betaproteobacteria bacterium]